MTCKKFETWLSSADPVAKPAMDGIVNHHLSECDKCRTMYAVDQTLEYSIHKNFSAETLPDSLSLKIDHAIDTSASHPKFLSKKRILGVAAAIVLFFFAYIFSSFSQGRIENLQQLSFDAVSRHLKGDLTMTFDARNIDAGLKQLSKELNFNVLLPNLNQKDFVLLGGRLCVVGKCETAYLFYKFGDKTGSLFIMDYDRFNFKMADGSRFTNKIKGYQTDIWKENGQVYTLVY